MKKHTLRRLMLILASTLVQSGPLFAWTYNQPASHVLGQSNFTTTDPGPTHMELPLSMYFDQADSRLFVADGWQNRVLVYDLSGGIFDGMSPAHVLGQPDPTQVGMQTSCNVWLGVSPTTSMGMAVPTSMAYDPPNKRLYVADGLNNRILVFNLTGGITDGMAPSWVIGQPDFTSCAPACKIAGVDHCDPGFGPPSSPADVTDHGFYFPNGLAFDGTTPNKRLFVADRYNSRVLVFDVTAAPPPAPSSWAPPAIGVLGQPDYVSNSYPVLPPIDATRINAAENIFYEPASQSLFVADESFVRSLEFHVPHGSINTTAVHELGQPDMFTGVRNAPTASLMEEPSGYAYDPVNHTAFVSDENNNRVLIFDVTGGLTNGMPAVAVLGQPDFTSQVADVSNTAMKHVEDIIYDSANGRLFVADAGNNRVLVFQQPTLVCTSPALICGTVKSAEDTTVRLAGIPIEVRSEGGKLLGTQKTDSNGLYSFSPSDIAALAPNKPYFVTPVTGRTQSAAPFYSPIGSLSAMGTRADFLIHGVPGTFQLTDLPPSSFILISTYAYTQAALPPSVGPGRSSASGFYSATVKQDGTAGVQVPALPSGFSYYLTCWLAQPGGPTLSYTRHPDPMVGSVGPLTVPPNQQAVIQCAP